jgi:hypothetical protein
MPSGTLEEHFPRHYLSIIISVIKNRYISLNPWGSIKMRHLFRDLGTASPEEWRAREGREAPSLSVSAIHETH